jgi:hypothetical protein
MINWNAIATPPHPVPLYLKCWIMDVHSHSYRCEFEYLVSTLDMMDRNYFGQQPAEPNAKNRQADLFGGAK